MSKIKIVGQEGTYDLESVEDVVILLAGEYYFKHDEQNLVRVKREGKTRLFRKTSPLICLTLNHEHCMKRDCIEIAPAIFIEKNHPKTVKLDDGSYTHRDYCVGVGDKWYLKTDERIVKTLDDGYQLKELCVELSSRYYSKGPTWATNTPGLVKINDDTDWVLIADTREITYWGNGEQQFKRIHRNDIGGEYINQVFGSFRDKTNPQVDRIDLCYALRSNARATDFGCYVLNEQYEWLNLEMARIRERMDGRNTEIARAKCNERFSDKDEVENIAKRISPEYRVWGGKENLFGFIGSPITSKQFSLTGGLGYGFGVEIETSAGVLSRAKADELEILAVGDRSIGAAEYVTGVLQGNRGINHLKKVFEAIAAETFVDDRCSIHVHVGSPPVIGATDYSLAFNKEFAVASIKLGTSIEEDLYRILPKSRNPYNKHCHSIMRYRNITEDNWRHYLAAFVFGPEENWKSELDFNGYLYGTSAFTKEARLGNWCGGRYKWLNLVRGYSACNSRTIEFRVFSPTVNFDKAYNFILISLAFTHVASKWYKRVMEGGVSLEEMVTIAYKDSPELLTSLLLFINERRSKFDRKIVYTGITPDRIRSIEPRISKPASPFGSVIDRTLSQADFNL